LHSTGELRIGRLYEVTYNWIEMNGDHRVRKEGDVSYELHITLLLNNFSCYQIHLLHSVGIRIPKSVYL
jgi:hypothetical protein